MTEVIQPLQMISIIFTLAAFAAYVNHKYIKLPNAIGLLVFSTVLSSALFIFHHIGIVDIKEIATLVSSIDFEQFVLHGILSVLLFVGALHVNINKLRSQKWSIGVLSTLGVFLSAVITGLILYWFSGLMGFSIGLIIFMVFGAIISPTDPVAVLSILDSATKNEALKSKIAGESLFNDGTGIVLFLLFVGLAFNNSTEFSFSSLNYGSIFFNLIKEILGGAIIGLACAVLAMYLIKSIDSFEVEILITISLALGCYALAEIIHVSAPIASVVAGLFMGNKGMEIAMAEKTREHVVNFWSLIDELLNSVLFLIIGLELVLINISWLEIVLGLLAIISVLLGRYLSLLICGIPLMKVGFNLKRTPILMTWAGLRGGISIALALSLPNFEYKELILGMTYMVVVFSIVVQGLSLSKVVKYFDKDDMREKITN